MMCRFYHKCECADSNAFTCTEGGGGNYCGKYRMLACENMDCDNPSYEWEVLPDVMEIMV